MESLRRGSVKVFAYQLVASKETRHAGEPGSFKDTFVPARQDEAVTIPE
jgi:hypothetical protein